MPKEPAGQDDELGSDMELPDHVNQFLMGDSEPQETPVPKRQKSDSETPPQENPTMHVSVEVHADAEMPSVPAEPHRTDDVIPKETVEPFTSVADQMSEDRAQEPELPTLDHATPIPEPSQETQETVTPIPEPLAPTPEPMTTASEPIESATEEIVEISFIPPLKCTEIRKIHLPALEPCPRR